jgi:CHAT domain-containing protein
MRQTLINKAIPVLMVCLILGPYFAHAARAGPEDSVEHANELLELSKKQNPTNHPLAIQTAEAALALFESANDRAGIATSRTLIGQYYYAQNSMPESARYYESALGLWREQHNLFQQVNALIMLGYIEGRNGEWLNGISYLTQALNLVDENDLSSMARIANGMGYIFNESGLPENGLTQFQRAREYYGRAKSYRYYTRSTLLTGLTQFLLQNYPTALTTLQEALDGFIALHDNPYRELDIAECHEHMGQVYIAMGQYGLALQELQLVLPVYESAGSPGDAAQVRALIGQIYEQQGAAGRARENYLKASKTFQEISNRVNNAAVLFALGRLEMHQRNYDAAEKYLKESIDNTEEIRRDLPSRVFAAAFSASVQDRYEAYVDCLMRKYKAKPSRELEVLAFQASEQAKARSLAELLRDTKTKLSAGTDPRLAEQERTLRQSIRAKVDQTITLLSEDYRKEDLHKLETSLTSLREQHHQLAERMRASTPHSDQSKEAVSYSVQQIQYLILEDDQTMLLEYFLGQDASYVWAITHDGVKVFPLPKAAEITDAVRRVYDIVSARPGGTDSNLNNATAALAQMVLGPLTGQLNASRVIVVADGALNYIPFQLLPAPSGNHEPLVTNYEIINVPSASILGQIRQEQQNRRPSTRILAAFGDPVFASNYAQFKNSTSSEVLAKANAAEPWRRAWRDIEVSADALDASVIQPLIYSKFELKNLSDIAGPGSLVARGFNASRQVLENTDLSKYSILHFATHGLLNPNSPELSGFFLSMVDTNGRAQDGFISMQDVYSLHAPVDLVVLSACRTALGKDVKGEGLIGLTRGFMHAGASSVVASLWKVDDEATAELMKHFYANMLQKGMRPAEALRAAQNTLRQNSQWQSPHFWAGFTLQGEFKQSIKLPPSVPATTTAASPKVQSAVGAGLLMTLLAGIGWGFWRRRTKTSSLYSTVKK